MRVIDQLHTVVKLPSVPTRIVSLVPSQTELLVSLGLQDSIVGITKFCVHPQELRKQKVIVGGTKQVDYEKLKSLQPDIIICNKEENTKEMVGAMQVFAPVWVSDIYTIDDVLKMIQSFGEIFEVENRSAALVKAIRNEQKDFRGFMKQKPHVKVAYVIWKNPWMIAGSDTYINELLALNNFENIASPGSRYPEVTLESLNEAELILLSTEPYPFKKADVSKLKNVLSGEVRLVDGEYFSWYGSRTLDAFGYYRTLH